MGKSKLERFEEVSRFDHVYELTDYQDNEKKKPRGRWRSDIFENSNPLTLELACGKGEYTLELARRNPDRNYVGVDIKGARIWKGAKRTLEQGLDNVRFLRIYIDHLDEYFGEDEVDELWITFPDPYPRYSDRNRRLTASKFLAIYQSVLKPEGAIHFKTDSDKLFEYSLRIMKETDCRVEEVEKDIHRHRPDDPLLSIKTYYEKKHIERGRAIHYLKFRLPEKPVDTG